MKSVGGKILAGSLCVLTLSCQAGVFRQFYEAALTNDPTLRAARQELDSSGYGVTMARAGLLPNVSLSLSNSHVTGSRTADNFLGQPVTSPLDYRSPQQVLSLRTPILNLEATQKYRQAQGQQQLAATVFSARSQELIDRLAQAYLQSLLANDNLRAAQAQITAAKVRGQMTARRLELGEGTRTEALSAKADLATADVQLVEATNQRNIAALALQQITGLEPSGWSAFPDAIESHLTPKETMDLQQWTERADASNPAIQARRQAVENARIAVARAQAGHYPRLDLVASVSNNKNESVSTLNQAYHQKSLGLQLNVPLYSGGYVSASAAQALADQEKAQAELEAEQFSVAAEVQRLVLAISSAPARLDALQMALDANVLLLEAARRGVVGGVRMQADIDLARQRVAESARDLAKARYEVALSQIRLHARAGTSADALAELADSLFAGPSTAGNAP